MNVSPDYFRDYLHAELERRRRANSRYSLRAFAKALGIDGSDLSRILAGKAIPSLKIADRVVSALKLQKALADKFLTSVAEAQKARRLSRARVDVKAPTAKEIDPKVYDRVSEWYHHAIIELTYVEGFKSDPKWIARALGITALEVRRALADLKLAGLLVEQDGRLKKAIPLIANKDRHSVSSVALRRQLQQIFGLAEDAIGSVPIAERCTLGLTVPIDEAKLPDVKRLADAFVNDLCQYVVSGPRTRVYQLALSFFPVQRKD